MGTLTGLSATIGHYRYSNTTITEKLDNICLLGIPIGYRNSPKIWLTQLKQKLKLFQHKRLQVSNKYGGAKQKAVQILARAVAVSALMYRAQSYTLNRTHQRALHVLHNETLCTISLLLWHAELRLLQAAVALPPIETTMQE